MKKKRVLAGNPVKLRFLEITVAMACPAGATKSPPYNK